MLLIVLLIILGIDVKFLPLYINDSYPSSQFAGLTYTGWCYWYHVLHVLEETNSKIALSMHLPSWKTVLRQINIQN